MSYHAGKQLGEHVGHWNEQKLLKAVILLPTPTVLLAKGIHLLGRRLCGFWRRCLQCSLTSFQSRESGELMKDSVGGLNLYPDA